MQRMKKKKKKEDEEEGSVSFWAGINEYWEFS